MSEIGDYTIDRYAEEILDIDEADRIGLLIKTAGRHEPPFYSDVAFDIIQLMLMPNKGFVWFRSASHSRVYIVNRDSDIQAFYVNTQPGIYFWFRWDHKETEWRVEEVNRAQAAVFLNPDGRMVMPEKSED